jgi:hypothetical protein
MKSEKFDLENLKELSSDEASSINGGESAWYWVAYGIGSVGRGVAYVWNEISRDPEYYAQYTMSA